MCFAFAISALRLKKYAATFSSTFWGEGGGGGGSEEMLSAAWLLDSRFQQLIGQNIKSGMVCVRAKNLIQN